jgi:hypothetical protein
MSGMPPLVERSLAEFIEVLRSIGSERSSSAVGHVSVYLPVLWSAVFIEVLRSIGSSGAPVPRAMCQSSSVIQAHRAGGLCFYLVLHACLTGAGLGWRCVLPSLAPAGAPYGAVLPAPRGFRGLLFELALLASFFLTSGSPSPCQHLSV